MDKRQKTKTGNFNLGKMKINKFSILTLILAMMIVSSCSKRADIIDNDPRYTKKEALKYIITDPDRMFIIIDSAVIVGNMDLVNANLEKAKCYYMSNKKDTALMIIDRILDNKEYGVNEETHADALILKTQIAKSIDNIVLMSQTAISASKLCHEIGGDYIEYAAAMDCNIGNCMITMGNIEEGLRKIDDAINSIGKINSNDSFKVLLNCYNTKAAALIEIENYDIVPELCDEILERLDSFKTIDDQISSEEDISSFIDHIRGSVLAKKTLAYIRLNDIESAKKTLNECQRTDWSKRKGAMHYMGLIYPELDMYNEFNNTAHYFDSLFYGKDPSKYYVSFKKAEARMEFRRGDFEKSYKIYKEVADMQDLIIKTDYKNELSKTLAAYEVNKAKQIAHESELKLLKLKIWVIIILVVLFLLASWSGMIILRRRRNKEITETIIDNHKVDETADIQVDATSETQDDKKTLQQMATLYAKIVDVMDNKKPYTDPEFDIIHLATLLGTNKSYISRTINKIEGKNFRTWLAEYRNNIVINSICANSEISISDLCEIAGYANRETLSRHFKSINGITLGEFKGQFKRN